MGLQLSDDSETDEIQLSMRHAATEINDLLDDSLLLQSVQEGTLVLNRRPTKLEDIVQYLKAAYIQTLKGRSAVVRLRLDKGLPDFIMCDESYIKR